MTALSHRRSHCVAVRESSALPTTSGVSGERETGKARTKRPRTPQRRNQEEFFCLGCSPQQPRIRGQYLHRRMDPNGSLLGVVKEFQDMVRNAGFSIRELQVRENDDGGASLHLELSRLPHDRPTLTPEQEDSSQRASKRRCPSGASSGESKRQAVTGCRMCPSVCSVSNCQIGTCEHRHAETSPPIQADGSAAVPHSNTRRGDLAQDRKEPSDANPHTSCSHDHTCNPQHTPLNNDAPAQDAVLHAGSALRGPQIRGDAGDARTRDGAPSPHRYHPYHQHHQNHHIHQHRTDNRHQQNQQGPHHGHEREPQGVPRDADAETKSKAADERGDSEHPDARDATERHSHPSAPPHMMALATSEPTARDSGTNLHRPPMRAPRHVPLAAPRSQDKNWNERTVGAPYPSRAGRIPVSPNDPRSAPIGLGGSTFGTPNREGPASATVQVHLSARREASEDLPGAATGVHASTNERGMHEAIHDVRFVNALENSGHRDVRGTKETSTGLHSGLNRSMEPGASIPVTEAFGTGTKSVQPPTTKAVDSSAQFVNCDTCDVPFSGRLEKERHSFTAHPPPIVKTPSGRVACSYDGCDHDFAREHVMRRHVALVHLNIREYACSECERVFGDQSTLNQHKVAVHQKKKPWECGFCGAKFTQSSSLGKHKRRFHPDAAYARSDGTASAGPSAQASSDANAQGLPRATPPRGQTSEASPSSHQAGTVAQNRSASKRARKQSARTQTSASPSSSAGPSATKR